MESFNPKELLPILENAAVSLPYAFRSRPMFGGIIAYADNMPFASLSDIGLALKIAPAEQEQLLALTGSKYLQYEPGQPISKSYIVVPSDFLKNAEDLAVWVKKSADFVNKNKKA